MPKLKVALAGREQIAEATYAFRLDLAGQPLHLHGDVRAGARKADVGDVDLQVVHQVQELELLLDRR